MDFYNNFKNGINIGGWLSQYDVNEDHRFNEAERTFHFQNFITEHDIRQIASWGADHVRLPIMADVILEEEHPNQLRQEGMFYINQCINWCEKYHLNIILDLHEIEGHGYMDGMVPPVLTDERIQNECVMIWRLLSEIYKDKKSPVIMFELLNEVHDPTSYLWRNYYKKMVAAIREIDKDRLILVGTNHANSPFCFPELELVEDDNIIYNFHYYEPLVFTHQLARFSEEQWAYGQRIHYPGEIHGFIEFLQKHPQWTSKYPHTAWDKVNAPSTMQKYMQGVLDFKRYTKKEVYCGEFGVVDQADLADRCSWLKDFIAILEKNRIGFAYWNYKEMDFGLVDKQDSIVNKELLAAVFKNSH